MLLLLRSVAPLVSHPCPAHCSQFVILLVFYNFSLRFPVAALASASLSQSLISHSAGLMDTQMRNKHKKLRFGIPTSHTVFVELLKVFARLSLHTRWPNDVAAVVPQLREVICEQLVLASSVTWC